MVFILLGSFSLCMGIVTFVSGMCLGRKEKDGCLPVIGIVGGLLLGIIGFGLLHEGYAIKNSPHGGNKPTIENVNSGEAYIDTVKIINKKDTTYQYQIQWNDSIINYINK